MTDKFAKSLIEVQKKIPTMPKTKQGYGYKYTDLDTIFTTVKPILTENGLGFYQLCETNDKGQTGIKTVLFNTDGDFVESFVVIPETTVKGATNAQNMGASITYMKRYAICAMLAISSDDDVDGALPQNNQQRSQAPNTNTAVRRQNQNYAPMR